MDITRNGAAAGVDWLKEGFALVRPYLLVWIGLLVLVVIAQAFFNMLPFVGGIVATVLGPVITAGVLEGCRSMDRGQEPQVKDLVAGFREPSLVRLILLGGATLAMTIGAILIPVVIAVFSAFAMDEEAWTYVESTLSSEIGEGADAGAESEEVRVPPHSAADRKELLEKAIPAVIGGSLGVILLMLPVTMAIWFAAPLVYFGGAGVGEALKGSFLACTRNIGAMTVYGFLLLCLAFLCLVTLGLGLLIVGPLVAGAHYRSYWAIFPARGEQLPVGSTG